MTIEPDGMNDLMIPSRPINHFPVTYDPKQPRREVEGLSTDYESHRTLTKTERQAWGTNVDAATSYKERRLP